jgi:putative membrane protein
MSSLTTRAAFIIGLGVAGCGGGQKSVPQQTRITGAAAMPQTTANVAPPLNDAQVLQVLHTANVGEIEQAKLARTNAKDPRVKHLARMMLKDHSAADHRGDQTVKKANLSMAPSDVSTAFEAGAREIQTNLISETGSNFDRAYLDAQIKQHRDVLNLIDQRLLRSAQTQDVKSLVETVRPMIEAHLTAAESLRKDLFR